MSVRIRAEVTNWTRSAPHSLFRPERQLLSFVSLPSVVFWWWQLMVLVLLQSVRADVDDDEVQIQQHVQENKQNGGQGGHGHGDGPVSGLAEEDAA